MDALDNLRSIWLGLQYVLGDQPINDNGQTFRCSIYYLFCCRPQIDTIVTSYVFGSFWKFCRIIDSNLLKILQSIA